MTTVAWSKHGHPPGTTGSVTLAVMDVAAMFTGRWIRPETVTAHYPAAKAESVRRAFYRLTQAGLLRSRVVASCDGGRRFAAEFTYNEECP